MFDILPYRKCRKCGKTKSLSEFVKRKKGKDGFSRLCLACNQENQRIWRVSNPEKTSQYSKKWRAANPEKAHESARVWKAANPSKRKEYRDRHYSNNKEKVLENNRKWQKDNSEKVREGNRKWAQANREKVQKSREKWVLANLERAINMYRKSAIKWAKSNPEKRRVNEKNRRARKRGGTGKITPQEWHALKEHYNYTCLCCGKREPEILLTLDHVLPLKLGGQNVVENAQPLCMSCNCRKGVKHIDYRGGR